MCNCLRLDLVTVVVVVALRTLVSQIFLANVTVLWLVDCPLHVVDALVECLFANQLDYFIPFVCSVVLAPYELLELVDQLCSKPEIFEFLNLCFQRDNLFLLRGFCFPSHC